MKKFITLCISATIFCSIFSSVAYSATPTREDVISSFYALKGGEVSSEVLKGFSDYKDIDENALKAMEWAVENGVINGYNDNTLRPKQEISDKEYNIIAQRVADIKDNTLGGNYSDEMKIEKKVDLSVEDGPDSVEREGDHKNSKYYSNLDFYNMESTDSLTILHNFKTYQQTSELSCGAASALMVMNWFGRDDIDEEMLWNMRADHSDKHIGTCLEQMMDMFDGVGGFDYVTTYDKAGLDKETIQNYLKNDTPIMVGWNDFGGHWQVIIGYDDMGTPDYQLDDVIIVADPYDTGDHNQDGYGVYQWARFINNFTFYNFFPEGELNDNVYIVATVKENDK